jgi:hypothetical protein
MGRERAGDGGSAAAKRCHRKLGSVRVECEREKRRERAMGMMDRSGPVHWT